MPRGGPLAKGFVLAKRNCSVLGCAACAGIRPAPLARRADLGPSLLGGRPPAQPDCCRAVIRLRPMVGRGQPIAGRRRSGARPLSLIPVRGDSLATARNLAGSRPSNDGPRAPPGVGSRGARVRGAGCPTCRRGLLDRDLADAVRECHPRQRPGQHSRSPAALAAQRHRGGTCRRHAVRHGRRLEKAAGCGARRQGRASQQHRRQGRRGVSDLPDGA